MFLDLSAAFDTVDHDILIRRLKTSYGLSGVVLQWFQIYLIGRCQYVRTGSSASSPTLIVCGVPQGSVLGPILFLLLLIQGHGLCPHLYADSTQLYGFCRPSASLELQNTITNCVDDVGRFQQAPVEYCKDGDPVIYYRTSFSSSAAVISHSELALTMSFRQPSFETSEYTSTLTSQ